jgi:hypothetical protein
VNTSAEPLNSLDCADSSALSSSRVPFAPVAVQENKTPDSPCEAERRAPSCFAEYVPLAQKVSGLPKKPCGSNIRALMKGFPNQVTDLSKLATGMREIVRLVDEGHNAKDDGILGEAFLRAGVIGKRNKAISFDEYLEDQRQKNLSDQSFRAGARFLRELYELMEFIDDSGAQVVVSDAGRQAAAFAGLPQDDVQTAFWRGVVQNLTKSEKGGPTSHPYQIMLHLVARKPGILRAKCALALEAEDDSSEEINRIVALAELPENEIIQKIGVTKRNWDNAKKVFPSFAEQLHDVVKIKGAFWLADAPGRDAAPADGGQRQPRRHGAQGVRTPRTSREVTSETIARAGNSNEFNDVVISPTFDPEAAADAIRKRTDRWNRHQAVLKALCGHLVDARLLVDPFDVLALVLADGILVEVKTLDGTVADERDRVRDALSQLLYYEAFVTKPEVGEGEVHKIACFESRISEDHQRFLNGNHIGVIWKSNGGFTGDDLATGILRRYFPQLL